MRTQRIPSSTAAVLSQVSYQLLIPCLLFVRVSTTLSALASPGPTLSLIVTAAALQVAVGALSGVLLAPLVDGGYPQSWLLAGWHPLRPSRSALEIASSIAGAAGIDPGASEALVAQPPLPPKGTRRLVILACTFGNSFTLPALFFSTLFSGARVDAAIGLAALFMLTLDSLVWTAGMAVVGEPQEGGGEARGRGHINPLLSLARHMINPPILAMLAGLVAGLTPSGRALLALLGPGGAASPPMPMPLELSAARGLARCALEVVHLLGGGALAVQVLVLAASLVGAGKNGGGEEGEGPREGEEAGHVVGAWSRAALSMLRPADAVEARMLAVVGAVRFVVMPCATLAMLALAGLPVAASPLLLFMLLVQAVMPPAQNLIVLLQLSPATRGVAPRFASFLLKLYALGTLPVTLWVTAFVARTGLTLG